MLFYIFFITIIIILYLWSNNIEIIHLSSNNIGNNILIIGGVHGNEPASSIYLKKYFHYKPKNGSIYIIHTPNKLGYLFNSRYLLHRLYYRDLNRNFTYNGLEPISKKIIEIVNKCDFIVDFHEGWGFYKDNLGSMGSGIYPNTSNLSLSISNKILENVNKNIVIDRYKFIIDSKYENIPNTLKDYCKNMNYILIETSGQNNIQSLEIRLNQIDTIVKTVLLSLNII